MRKFRFSFVISSSKDIHQSIPPSFHKLLLIEMTCKKWCPCFTLHLYFFLFTILASIREFIVDQIVLLFFFVAFCLHGDYFRINNILLLEKLVPLLYIVFITILVCQFYGILSINTYIGISDLLPDNHDIRMSRFNQISSHRGDWLSNGWICMISMSL